MHHTHSHHHHTPYVTPYILNPAHHYDEPENDCKLLRLIPFELHLMIASQSWARISSTSPKQGLT